MAARGRPTAPRGIFSIDEPPLFLPTEVLLDTSFVVAGLIESQPHHAACRMFLERLLDASATVMFSRLLELELHETAFRVGLQERHGRQWKRFRVDGRARRHAGIRLSRVTTAWERTLSAIPVDLHRGARGDR